ncbi:ATP-binding protein [Crossiella equi]|nr:LuxR C-terminal-related transcriptional regulator [Crossiella equi]
MLPAEVTSFVGRRQELTAIRQLMASTRLLTLTGPGGVGKTRLVVRAAEQMSRAYPDGVHFVGLDALRHGDLLPATIGAALQIPDTAADTDAQLVEFLRDKHLLLVLDNCEHVIDDTAHLVGRILAGAPHVRVLATSRQVLDIEGEQAMVVPPLAVPRVGTRREAAKLDAMTLFTDRAADSVRGFTLDADNWSFALRICAKLDGMPLAIELAVAWLRTLSIQELADELDQGLNLLDKGGRNVRARQKTLRATIQWSYELASYEEQLLWARLSVFSDGATLEAIEAVCAGDVIHPDDVLGILASLVDKSIVQRDDQFAAPRFRMLEAVRQFGASRLAASKHRVELGRRHRDFYLGMARGAEADWYGGRDQGAVYQRLRGEHANLRLALEFCLANPGESAVGLELVTRLHVYWMNCGHYGEGRRWFNEVLAVEREPSPTRAKALSVCGYLNNALGDSGTAREQSRAALAWAVRSGHVGEQGRVRVVLGGAALLDGDLRAGARLCGSARAYLEAAGEWSWSLTAEAVLLMSMAFGGDSHGVMTRAKAALAEAERLGQEWCCIHIRYALALAQHTAGRHDSATKSALTGVHAARKFNDVLGVCMHVELLAWIAEASGRAKQAAQLLGLVERLWPLLGGKAMLGSQTWVEPHDECAARTRAALGAEAYQSAYARGMANGQDFAQAVSFVLDERRTSPGVGRERQQLTKREWQVAELIAKGMTNKEIAAQLVVATRTAETHVDHVLAKLGFTSRSQIATWVAENPRTG